MNYLTPGTRYWSSCCCPALQRQGFSEGGEGGESPEPAKISEGGPANRKESSERKRGREKREAAYHTLEVRGKAGRVFLVGNSAQGSLAYPGPTGLYLSAQKQFYSPSDATPSLGRLLEHPG